MKNVNFVIARKSLLYVSGVFFVIILAAFFWLGMERIRLLERSSEFWQERAERCSSEKSLTGTDTWTGPHANAINGIPFK